MDFETDEMCSLDWCGGDGLRRRRTRASNLGQLRLGQFGLG